ncbi:DUF4411 family protein [Chitinimonas arctica]|uniref:DUF4411 family protein n=1 Tax=Chitinimonas arctica TaxID=2594795 RepID=A0A516SGL3_9NEIS|nr:DUF4411 family protein [Chitinimonas arctica]QDQ27240.1 DUF4411 family protein [Chitinimonas arctica]
MQSFDASSMIYAWDNYPVSQFPGLWTWLADRINARLVRMSAIAFDEVEHKVPECSAWLRDVNLDRLPVSEVILHEALRIKGLLGVVEDKFGGGVGENDLLIIATSKIHGLELVTDEKFQAALPKLMPNYKIPAVCGLATVDVRWINFIGYLKRSEAVFG